MNCLSQDSVSSSVGRNSDSGHCWLLNSLEERNMIGNRKRLKLLVSVCFSHIIKFVFGLHCRLRLFSLRFGACLTR